MSDDAPASNPMAAANNPSAAAKPPSRGAASSRKLSSAHAPSMDGPSSARQPSAGGAHPAPFDPHGTPTLNLSEWTTKHSMDRATLDDMVSPTGATTPNPFGVRAGTLDFDDYFVSSGQGREDGEGGADGNSMVRAICRSTPSGPSSCACMGASSPR